MICDRTHSYLKHKSFRNGLHDYGISADAAEPHAQSTFDISCSCVTRLIHIWNTTLSENRLHDCGIYTDAAEAHWRLTSLFMRDMTHLYMKDDSFRKRAIRLWHKR